MPPIPVKFSGDHMAYEAPGGVLLPGITSRGKRAGLLYEFEDSRFMDPEKGNRVHAAIHYAVEGDLDEASVDPAELGYVRAAQNFIQEEAVSVKAAEYAVGNLDLGYATKIDLLCVWRTKLTLVNWKSSPTVFRWYSIQSALEALLFTPEPVQRLGVHLSADGSYKLQHYTDRKDYEIAKAALACASWVDGGKK